METAIDICRPGGTVGYVGVPHGVDEAGLPAFDLFTDNITLAGGVAPVRAHADDLLEDVLSGTLDPSPIFTKTVGLENIAEGYRAMDEREALKVLVRP
jgi:alcohol dehydrogenase